MSGCGGGYAPSPTSSPCSDASNSILSCLSRMCSETSHGSRKTESCRWFSHVLAGPRKVKCCFCVWFLGVLARASVGRHVGDASANTAFVVDALKVSLAVGRRGALEACRAQFRIRARAAADGDGIPIQAGMRMPVDGKLLWRATGHHVEGTQHHAGLEVHRSRM